jgi:thiol-disulfide isomerase/thioredoxin
MSHQGFSTKGRTGFGGCAFFMLARFLPTTPMDFAFRNKPALWGAGLLALCLSTSAWAQFDKQAWPARTPTPRLDVQDMQGRRWSQASLKGQVVVLNFWATWCAPCKVEMPSLQALHDAPHAPVVIAINVKEPKGRVTAFLNHANLNLPVVLDEQGELARQWGVRIYPTTVLIGPDGQARWRVVGELDWAGPQAQAWLQDLQRLR